MLDNLQLDRKGVQLGQQFTRSSGIIPNGHGGYNVLEKIGRGGNNVPEKIGERDEITFWKIQHELFLMVQEGSRISWYHPRKNTTEINILRCRIRRKYRKSCGRTIKE